MKLLATLFFVSFAAAVVAQPKDTRFFELRIYYAASGKLDALISRFSSNTTRIFEKHGMQNIGYWVPVNNDKSTLYYILAFPNREAREKSWTAFRTDPEWMKVKADSEVNGKLVDSVKSVFLNVSDVYNSGVINDKPTGADRTFELRTYYCLPGRLPNLLTRFKDHTLKIFEDKGMQNIVYFVTDEPEGKQPLLVYLLAHKNMEEAKKSWDAFLVDPNWVKARDASEKDGKILEKLEAVYLKPLPFSKIK